MSDTLYIKMDRSVEITVSEVTIGDIAKIECKNKTIVNKVKSLRVLKADTMKKNRYLVSIMKVIEMIEEKCPDVDISNLGETECVIEVKKGKKTNTVFEKMKVLIVCLILFFGAGFSIMSFNNDVDINSLFGDICKRLTGDKKTGMEVLEFMYSVGIATGIIVFYNHFGPKKLSNDPTPIEVEMRTYEDDIYNTLIEGHNRNDGRLDIK